MNGKLTYLHRAMLAFNPESRVLGFGRTLIALAQASVFVFTPASHLFVPVGGDEAVVECDGLVRSASAYCLASGWGRQVVSWVLLSVPIIAALTSWGAVIGETAMAILLLTHGRGPVVAVCLSVPLHALIIVQLGIVSFGFIMIGVVLCAAARSLSPAVRGRWERGEKRPETAVAAVA
ncbi:hypothetical protein NE857_02400 [Nocardiopsis exhalans]|uniref:Uncharacterized protein n=1 Tax=Nocardiopsis exhalans TaxID=163604 RepID=A0ABY5DBD9_9ACTN|nr:hypothetical protein [Nocardiopsis exhalans]USY20528.1 hypothetical protein NE857_02400 [Nocardiopsis exhalans]